MSLTAERLEEIAATLHKISQKYFDQVTTWDLDQCAEISAEIREAINEPA